MFKIEKQIDKPVSKRASGNGNLCCLKNAGGPFRIFASTLAKTMPTIDKPMMKIENIFICKFFSSVFESKEDETKEKIIEIIF